MYENRKIFYLVIVIREVRNTIRFKILELFHLLFVSRSLTGRPSSCPWQSVRSPFVINRSLTVHWPSINRLLTVRWYLTKLSCILPKSSAEAEVGTGRSVFEKLRYGRVGIELKKNAELISRKPLIWMSRVMKILKRHIRGVSTSVLLILNTWVFPF